MPIKQYGSQSYSFGLKDTGAQLIAAVVGLVPEKIDISAEPEIAVEGKNIYNQTVAYAIDTEGMKTFTMNGYITSKALFDAALGTAFTHDSKVFIVNKRDEAQEAGVFKRGTISGVSFPLIVSTTGTTVVA